MPQINNKTARVIIKHIDYFGDTINLIKKTLLSGVQSNLIHMNVSRKLLIN